MINKGLFKKSRNVLEGGGQPPAAPKPAPRVPDEMCTACPSCKSMLFSSELDENSRVCPKCGYHFRMNPRERLALICDAESFFEWDAEMMSKDVLGFPGYHAKLNNARIKSREKDAVVTGKATIGGYPCAVFVMDSNFMMGSMGCVVGEKITRLFERATVDGLPVVGYTVSGGARMQEGILSLMQMAKTSGAVKKHSDAGLLYITVLTDPTTGGVTASFAMEGDILLAEPRALIGFAGPRVIEQTIRQQLPPGFQRSEFLLEKGFLDEVVPRRKQKEYLTRLLMLHRKEEN